MRKVRSLIRLILVLCLLGLRLTIIHVEPALAYDDSGAIGVSASIAPTTDSFGLQISADPTTSVTQNTVITYKVTYQSNLVGSTPLTIQAQWYQGTIEGAGSPSVNLVNYQPGSATLAYSTTEPIVDLTQNTITWPISSLPAGSGLQTVYFKLKTNEAYTGSKIATFPIAVRITRPNTFPDVKTIQAYQYQAPLVQTSPIPSPTVTPITASNNETPTITSIQVTSISTSAAKIQLLTSNPAQLIISYGTSSSLLGNSIKEGTATRVHSFNLSNLLLDTQYYFQISQLGTTSSTPLSEVFTFNTASALQQNVGPPPTLLSAAQPWGVTFSQTAGQAEANGTPNLIAISSSVLDMQFVIPNSQNLKVATVIVRSPDVLGASTDNNDDFQSQNAIATEIGESVFVGKVKLPTLKGNYEVVLQTEDVYGNVNESKLADIFVVSPMKVIDQKGNGLAGAKILLSRFNDKSQLFEILPNSATSQTNPVTSDTNGIVNLSLLPGRYQADITNNGFEKQEITFNINANNQEDLPQVTLKQTGVWPLNYLRQLYVAIGDINSNFLSFVRDLELSPHFYVLVYIYAVILCLVLTLRTLYKLLRKTTLPSLQHPDKTRKLKLFIRYQVISFVLEASLLFVTMSSIFYVTTFVSVSSLILLCICATSIFLGLHYLYHQSSPQVFVSPPKEM